MVNGQKNLTMATEILESAPWSMVKMVILWSKLVVKFKVYHFDHRTFAFRPWSWSKWVVLWLKFVVKFYVDHFDHRKCGFWPWSWSKF